MSGPMEIAGRVGGERSPTSESEAVRVFLVHSRELVRLGLRDLLEHADDLVLVDESPFVTGSVDRVERSDPDVVVIDVSLPDGAVGLARDIAARCAHAKCVIVACSDQEQARRAADAAGAPGYLTEDVRARDFLDVVRRVARGQRMSTRAGAGPAAGSAAGADDVMPITFHVQDLKLTGREQQVLTLIGAAMTNRQIGDRLGLAEKTVKNYVSALMAKLHVERRTQAAIYDMTHKLPPAAQQRSTGAAASPVWESEVSRE